MAMDFRPMMSVFSGRLTFRMEIFKVHGILILIREIRRASFLEIVRVPVEEEAQPARRSVAGNLDSPRVLGGKTFHNFIV